MTRFISVFVVVDQAGDKEPGINPVVRLFIVDTQHVRSAHKEILPPTEHVGMM